MDREDLAHTPSNLTPGDYKAFRWIGLAAVFSGLFYLVSPAGVPIQARSEELYIAAHLAQGEGYRSPFSSRPDAPPTSWCPPIYPACIACIDRLGGMNTPRITAMLLLFGVFVRTATALAAFELGRLLFGRRAGMCGAILLMLHPLFYLMIGYYWDNYLALAMFLWLTVAAVRMSRSPQPLRRAAMQGAGLAILSLTNSAYICAFPLLVLLAARKLQWRQRAINCVLACATFVAVLTPWTIRNYVVFHKLFFVRANANVELWIGNQSIGDGLMTEATVAAHPGESETARTEILRIGEIAYFQEAGKRFREELSSAPGAYVRRCVNRVRYLLVLDPRTPGGDYTVLCATITAALALARLCFLDRTARWVWFVGWLAVLPYIVTQVINRYTLPLAASSLILGGGFVDLAIALCARFWRESRETAAVSG